MSMWHRFSDNDRKTEVLGDKLALMPYYLPKIQLGLGWDETQDSKVICWQLSTRFFNFVFPCIVV